MQTLNYQEENPTGPERQQSTSPNLLLFLPMKSAVLSFPAQLGFQILKLNTEKKASSFLLLNGPPVVLF
jgi:hypothetical protein